MQCLSVNANLVSAIIAERQSDVSENFDQNSFLIHNTQMLRYAGWLTWHIRSCHWPISTEN